MCIWTECIPPLHQPGTILTIGITNTHHSATTAGLGDTIGAIHPGEATTEWDGATLGTPAITVGVDTTAGAVDGMIHGTVPGISATMAGAATDGDTHIMVATTVIHIMVAAMAMEATATTTAITTSPQGVNLVQEDIPIPA